MVVDALEHRDGARAVEHLGRRSARAAATRRGEHPAVEVEPDDVGHHLGGRPVVRARRSPSRSAASSRSRRSVPSMARGPEPRRQHPLHHQHALGDHQPLAGRQIGPAVDAVEVAEVVEPRVGGVDRRRRRRSSLTRLRRRAPTSGRQRRAAPCVVRGRAAPAAPCSHSWLARRSASINSVPLGDTDTRTWRPSAGCALRATNPSSASEAITRVIDGGRTRSRVANAPGVIAPSLARVDSADNCDRETGESGRRNRNWRASRMTASDKSLANRESVSFTRQRIASGSFLRVAKHGRLSMSGHPGLGWQSMNAEPPEPVSPNRLPCPRSCSSRGRSSS